MAGVAMCILTSTSRQLGILLVQETKFLYSVSNKLEKLQLDLEWLQCFLQDADKQQHESRLIRKWISQIRDFAYEAEDIIEKYTVRVTRPRESGLCNTLKWVSCAPYDAMALHDIGAHINSLSERMSDLSSRLQLCGVKAIAKDDLHIRSTRLVDPRRINPQIRENDIIVGLDEDACTLIHQLINTNKNVVVISGMGGLGKTTLARKVWNDQSIKVHFDTRVWIYVSQDFQAMDIFKEILRKLWENDEGKRKSILSLGDEELSEKIRDTLKEKSYLLVLDDVWNVAAWNHLKLALSLPSNSSSKLLLTTRNHELQDHVDVNGYSHKQEPLNPDDSWKLLKAIVSQGEYDIDSEMQKLGEMMLKQSLYLPIAIVAIGGILKSKSTTHEWKAVLDNIHSIFTFTTQEGMRILDILEMSYNDLPLFLRPCFLYLASFPEDYEISTTRLYHLWEAEGLISTDSNNLVARFQRVVTLRDIAEAYLEELISRSMVQVERRNDKGKIKSCRMHDLMRDLCIQKSTEEDYVSMISTVEELREKQSSVSIVHSRLRRLAIHINNDDNSTSSALNKAVKNSKQLRSILLLRTGYGRSAHHILKSCAKNCLLLRVVDLEAAGNEILPKELQRLIHLKYLSLRDTSIKKLPFYIVKFQCLETLDLRVSAHIFIIIPNLLWKLRKLRHLHLPIRFKVHKPLWLHTLSHLETLKNFVLDHCRVEDLCELKSLRRFTILNDIYFSPEEMENLKVILSSSNIALGLLAKPMHLEIKGELLNEELVDQLLQLQGYKLSVGSLVIKGTISMSLRDVQIAFWNLISITFFENNFVIDPMPVLERLPKLSELALRYKSFIGKKMICSRGGFNELTHLTLEDLYNVEELIVDESAMPRLQCVVIKACSKLKPLQGLLPDTVHIEVSSSLWEL